MTMRLTACPNPAHRLIPSQFPPIGLFDTVTTPADLQAVIELAGWTNDRLVANRLVRLPEAEWVYGRPNSSVIMASFLHVSPAGMRFNNPDLGAWYASPDLSTAITEVAHHLRREACARQVATMERIYRTYIAHIEGDGYEDLRADPANHADLYNPSSYTDSQAYGEAARVAGRDGLIYNSLRHANGVNIVAYRPTKIHNVTQTDHFEITVTAQAQTIQVRRLNVT